MTERYHSLADVTLFVMGSAALSGCGAARSLKRALIRREGADSTPCSYNCLDFGGAGCCPTTPLPPPKKQKHRGKRAALEELRGSWRRAQSEGFVCSGLVSGGEHWGFYLNRWARAAQTLPPPAAASAAGALLPHGQPAASSQQRHSSVTAAARLVSCLPPGTAIVHTPGASPR
jgi:hypothetical protein